MYLKSTIIFALQLAWVTFSHAQVQQPQIVKIEFHTLTRGAYEHVKVTKDSVQTEKKTKDDQKERKSIRKLKPKELENLLNTIQNVSLQDIPSLKSPTNDRAFDGAYHSTIIITTADNQTFTHMFDNEKPNEKLQMLMLAIRKITKFNNP